MQLELHCPSCVQSFALPADSAAGAFLDWLAEQGVWCPLGDGETIEDNLYRALATHDAVCCPQCSTPATVSQESLSRFARDLLVQW